MSVTSISMPRTRIEEAKARITIPVLWRMFNLRGDPGSPCRSPFREDRSPSFSVCYEGRGWKDHATAEGGDAIDFLAKIKGISREEAFVSFLELVDKDIGSYKHQANSTLDADQRLTSERKTHKILTLEGIERCSVGDLYQIAKLRFIPLVGLRLAHERKLLFMYTDPYQGRCWLITDDARRNAIYRRLDGKRFHYREVTEDKKEGPKSKTFLHSEANWPIGIAQASSFPTIALCEGAPDFLAAFWLAYAGAGEQWVAPVCMTGASCSIHPDALSIFRGKRVRIFGHADERGKEAMGRWAEQLRAVQAEVDGFFFEGLLKADGSPIEDLNDFILADHKRSGCPIEVTTGAFDFALEGAFTK
jgi:CHC2 zinc finger